MDLRLTFNASAENYDRMRPTYCSELFDRIIDYAGIRSNSFVVEVGIGTGQATGPFLETGCRVTAVELGENLANFCREKFRTFSNLQVLNMDFESFETTDPADLLISATAFHWIPRPAGYLRALSLLKQGGTIALFWNRPFVPDPELDASLQAAYARHMPGSAPPKRDRRPIHDGIQNDLRLAGFEDVRLELFRQTRSLTASEYVSLLNTYSDHLALADDVRDSLYREIGGVIERAGGTIVLENEMDLHLGRKPSGSEAGVRS